MLRRIAIGMLCLFGMSVLPFKSWAEPSLPVEKFFQKPRYAGTTLSPNGQYVVVLAPFLDRMNAMVVSLDKRVLNPLTMLAKADVLHAEWINDERLLIQVGDLQVGSGEPPRANGLALVDRKDGNLRVIGDYRFHSVLHVGARGDGVVFLAYDKGFENLRLMVSDFATGETHEVRTLPTHVEAAWVVDANGTPRSLRLLDVKQGKSVWKVQKTKESDWEPVATGKRAELTDFRPLAFANEGNVIFVSASTRDGRRAVYEYDLETKAWAGPVIKHPERDVDGRFIRDPETGRIVGFSYEDDRPTAVWFDAEWAQMQKTVDDALPGMVNQIQRAAGGERWLVVSSSDRNPGEAYLLDRKTKQMERLFVYAPDLKPETMAPMRWVSYQARDGLRIPALLTEPQRPAGTRLPLIVHIHGGPYVPANRWVFDPEVQFLASRGYAVLQPQFRGTKGFGDKHLRSGFRKWGEEMQDDLEDGVRWAVEQGIADPDRVCFFGASYGGYAAIWQTIRNPGLIKCSVASLAVTSMNYMFEKSESEYDRMVMKLPSNLEAVGDPATEQSRFSRISPLEHVGQVGAPILLAYGEEDKKVVLAHGKDFRWALWRKGKDYEWVAYDDEGHGFTKPEHVRDFYTRVEKFLAKHLQAPKPVKKAD